MNDSYKELLVKKERTMKDSLLRGLCMTVTVLLLLMMLVTVTPYNLIFFVACVAMGVLTYFVRQWTDIEYEYLYLDREITVDKVFAKSRRKRVATINVDKMEILAPVSSHQLDSYRNRQVKTVDYSAGGDVPDQRQYAMYYEGNEKYLLNLTEDFIKPVKSIAPRKVFTD